ncbi:HAMP domain-containing sensor histidine kinase [Microbacterium sp. X-17]|uniref:sensor histidine kinase n=1 Tax=Microbacterium sp. X-17 TaxID=3144404 RepID=UPI0031F4AF46
MDQPRRGASTRARMWGAMLVVAGAGVFVFAVVLFATETIVFGLASTAALARVPGYLIAAVMAVATIAVGTWIAVARLAPRAPAAAPEPAGESDEGEPDEGADEAFERQRQLLDDVRHELKTPITIVRGYLETMDADDPVDVATTREIGISELDRMNRLVEDIELLASVEAAEHLTPSAVDLRTLTTRIGELVAVIPDHPWRVVAHGDAVLHADPDRLLQAWLQLADNAAKHTPADSPVEIGSDVAGDRAHLWVRDHGPGVPPAARHRIFRRAGRVQPHRGVEGSGLGLAIVDAIARAHDGGCAVTTTDGGGATFTIDLPIGRATPSAPAPIRAEDVVLQRQAAR